MRAWRIASTTLASPATPAAITVWPMWPFTEPSAQRVVPAEVALNARVSASTSTGSPSGVAVPWPST